MPPCRTPHGKDHGIGTDAWCAELRKPLKPHGPVTGETTVQVARGHGDAEVTGAGAPDMPDTISGAEMRRKGTPHSFAIAFARAVLPQPGGPYSRTPLGGCTPSQEYTYMHAATVVFTRVLFCNPCISCVCTCKGQRPVASGSRNPFSHPCTHSWHLAAAARQLYVCIIMCVLPRSTFAAREEGQTA